MFRASHFRHGCVMEVYHGIGQRRETCGRPSPAGGHFAAVRKGNRRVAHSLPAGGSPYAEVRRVACEFHEGMLSLRGRVSSYYLKQIAQTVVLGMEGVEEIHNQLEVVTPPDRR